ncbi:MAG TPA: FAD-dependent oxidoreductase, partial [Burkholderiaceae bacterium]|nr:FAD-dependent oxidoreductase [Burkholderiaceae bacterium]
MGAATERSTQVLVIGAGPVGLTIALDLSARGVEVVVVESRHRGEPPSVKCNHVSARSMEIFRRLGVAPAVRNAGLPPDYPNDVAYRTTTTGIELTRIPIPCRRDRYTATGGPDTWWPTPEPPHRINQIFLEPILFEHAQRRVTILCRTQLQSFEQREDAVVATVRDLESGVERRLQAQFLIGCDGGRSLVRRTIGATLVGDAVVQRVQSTHIRAPALLSLLKAPPAWGTFSLNPRRSGNVYAIDGRETWLVHNYLRDDEPDFESVDRDWAIRQILGVGGDFEYEVIAKEDWFGRRLVADRFRDRRAFLCGDAAHLWVPYAGYGMNAGIADAANLAWLLAAHLKGWAPAAIVDAYERERLPITEQVSHFAMNHAHEMSKRRAGVPAEIEDGGPAGEAARERVGRDAYDLNVQQYCAAGLNFGYFYDDSPIIAYDDDTPPPYTMGSFTESTVPGCRLPHFRLADGRSLYDALSDGYTLLRFDASVDVEPLAAAARAVGMPLAVLDVAAGDVPAAYRHRLVLARPDQHVGWRGDAVPD